MVAWLDTLPNHTRCFMTRLICGTGRGTVFDGAAKTRECNADLCRGIRGIVSAPGDGLGFSDRVEAEWIKRRLGWMRYAGLYL